MVNQQSLRQTASRNVSRASQIQKRIAETQQRKQKEAQKKIIQTQQKSETQKQTLEKEIDKLQNKLKNLRESYSGGTKAGRRKNQIEQSGVYAQLNTLKGALSNISEGGYYQDISEVLTQSKKIGTFEKNKEANKIRRATTSKIAPEYKAKLQTEATKKQINELKKQGATNIKVEGGSISYSLPSTTTQAVSSQVKTGKSFGGINIVDYGKDFVGPLPKDTVSAQTTSLQNYLSTNVGNYNLKQDLKEKISTTELPAQTYSIISRDIVGKEGQFIKSEVVTTGEIPIKSNIVSKELPAQTRQGEFERFDYDKNLKANLRNIASIDKKINKLYSNNVNEDGVWTGSESSYEAYTKLSEQRNRLSKEYEGFSIFKKSVSDFDVSRPISSSISVVGGAVGTTAENLFFNLNKGSIGKEFTYYEPQFGTQQIDSLTGQPLSGYKTGIFTEEDIKGTSELVGKSVKPAAELGVWAVGGAPLFYGYLGELGANIVSEKIKTGEVSKELKTEGILAGGILLTGGAIKRIQYLKSPIVKGVEGGFKVTTRADELFGRKVNLRTFETTPSTRGRYFLEEKIKQPKPSVDVIETIGFESGSKIKYPEQITEQFSSGGKRTIVKEFGKGGKEIILYEGIPYVNPEAYKGQLKYLTDIGIKEPQARNILRYQAPKVERQILKEGNLFLKDNKAFGQFRYAREKPVITIDEQLGIKTRGGKSKFETIYVERKGGKLGDVNVGIEESSSILTRTPPKKNALDLLGFNFQEGVTLAESSRVSKLDVLRLKTQEGKVANIFEDFGVERITGVSIKRNAPIGFDNKLFVDTGKTTIISRITPEENILSFEGGGRRSSQEYIQSLYSPELVTVPRPKITPPKEIKPTTTDVKLEILESKPIVKPSLYYGTGQYERTEEIGTLDLVNVQPIISDVKVLSEVKITPLAKTRTETIKLQKQFDLGKTKEASKVKTDVLAKDILKTETKQKQSPKLRQALSQLLKTKQRNELQNIGLQKTKTRTKETKLEPKIKPKIKIKDNLLKRLSTKAKEGDLFEAFVTKGGKDISVGKAKTQLGAEELLEKKIKGTLRASGFLEKGGVKLKASELLSFKGDEFRVSKLDVSKIVERKSKRLRKGTTGKDIQYFRITGSKKPKRKSNTLFNL